MTRNQNKMADLPDPCAQALLSYILVTSFHNQQCDLVSSRNAPPYKVCGEKRCVTILKTAARETNNNVAESEEANPSSIEEVNSLGTVYVRVCLLPFIPHKKYSSTCRKLEPGRSINYIVAQLYSEK